MTRALAIVSGLVVLAPAAASAQTSPAPTSAPPPMTPFSPGSTYVPVPGGTTTSFGPNTTSPNGTIGGGNATESSARPITGDEQDTFDLGRPSGGGGTAHGDENGPIFVGPAHVGLSGGEVPGSHVVRRGDTLWGICDQYFENPYQWPRIWSYNPQIRNPHWIYPGDEIRLKTAGPPGAGGQGGGGPAAASGTQGGGQRLDTRRRQVPPGTVFLRDQGWIRDSGDEVWGDITGASEDKMFLTDGDEVYLHVDKGHDVRLGQELTVFKPIKSMRAGTIVQINGTARVDDWNAQDRIARAQIVESIGVIERGARVGPLARRFTIVPPKRNEAEVQAHVLASVHPQEFWGQNAVVFIDKGESAGLVPGNRLFILRRGDAWRQSLVTPSAGYRVSPDDERPAPPIEQTPGSRADEKNYPDEVIGELRVVWVKKDSAACLVTASKLEIEPGDLAVARKGY